jgi:PAS domain S-box-containing protein
MNAYILVIVILLVALAITASLLIFVVLKVFMRKGGVPTDTDAFLAKVLDGFPVPVFEIDKDHKVTQWNKALEALSGIKKADVMGTSGQWKAFYGEKRAVLADMIADGASESEIATRYKNRARKSALIEGAYEAEDFFPSLGDKGKWYKYTASPIKTDGKSMGAIEILEDVSERHIAEENLRYYAGQVTRVQEEERKHIARELHDTTVQTLVALIYQLDNYMHENPNLAENEVTRLKAMQTSLKRAVEEVRRFSRALRPPVLDDLGLIPVLEWLAGELKKSYELDVQMEISGSQRRLQPDTELALFRIIQEALINSAKHAQVKSATLKLEYMRELVRATIVDDGEGFDLPDKIGSLPRGGKLGLAGIEERVQLLGGDLRIQSEKGKGTVVRVELPV